MFDIVSWYLYNTVGSCKMITDRNLQLTLLQIVRIFSAFNNTSLSVPSSLCQRMSEKIKHVPGQEPIFQLLRIFFPQLRSYYRLTTLDPPLVRNLHKYLHLVKCCNIEPNGNYEVWESFKNCFQAKMGISDLVRRTFSNNFSDWSF